MMFENIVEIFTFYDLKVARAMKYPSVQRFERALDEFCKCKTLKEWLQKDYRDAYHTAQSFYYQALKYCQSLDDFEIPHQSLKAEFEECKEFLSEFENACSVIFVETSQGLMFGAICREKKYTIEWIRSKKFFFPPDDSLNYKGLDEILEVYGKAISQHYLQNNGEILEFCKIRGYRVEILGRVYRFDCQGRFQRFLSIPLEKEDLRPLFTRLKESLEKASYFDLALKMGYDNHLEIFKNGIDLLRECGDLKEWIGRGFYALKMKSNHFFIKLCEILLDEEYMAISECKKIRNLITRCEKFDGVIYVLTEEKKHSLSLREGLKFFWSMKEIYLDRRIFCQKSKGEVLQICGEIAKNHYARNDGELEVWGKITGYLIKIYGDWHLAGVDGRFRKHL